MDWYSWLSKTGLEPSNIYEYGLALSNNELEEDDTAYFNHEFLQSMGISIAKHRLEILKLVRKEKGSGGSHLMAKLIMAIKKTKRRVANYFWTWLNRDNSARVVVKTMSFRAGCKGAMLKRNKTLMVTSPQGNAATLLLTNGNSPSVRVESFRSPLIYDLCYDQGTMDGRDYHESCEDGVEEIKWDALFQNLKPT